MQMPGQQQLKLVAWCSSVVCAIRGSWPRDHTWRMTGHPDTTELWEEWPTIRPERVRCGRLNLSLES